MKAQDVVQVLDLLTRYLDRTEIAQVFSREEFEHSLLGDDTGLSDKVVYSYVVEEKGKITDFFSFYRLESTVIGNPKHDTIRAAYLFYYATEAAFETKSKDKEALKKRLNQLMNDALILAKKVCHNPVQISFTQCLTTRIGKIRCL